ncbi:MAG: AAA family ATPase [Reyranellaceae bacterium]
MPSRKVVPSAVRCQGCGTTARPDANYCSHCGRALGAEADQAQAAHGTDLQPLTVLFCDLVDSTAMASRLDPEVWQDILVDYQRTVRAAIASFGGHVARVVGDGILAYFGWPIPHDDDGERAIRAGLQIVHDLRRLGRVGGQDGGVDLHVRLAAHSGTTLVDSAGEAYGETPHLAARAQAAAPLDTVVVTDSLRVGAAGRFPAVDLGLHDFKGLPQPVRIFAIDSPSVATALGGTGLGNFGGGVRLPLIGRGDQMADLDRLWSAAVTGRGQTALVLGEPGIGKTRLVAEFRHAIESQPHRWIECAASVFRQRSPYFPVIGALKEAIGLSDAGPQPDSLRRLERLLAGAGIPGLEATALLADLLGLEGVEHDATRLLSMEERRQRQSHILARWIAGNDAMPPTVFVLEDIHWCDSSTMELFAEVQRRQVRSRLLVVLTGRPEASGSPLAKDAVTITLPRLQEEETVGLLSAATGTSTLSAATRKAIVRRSEGVPLFVEEFARLSLQSTDGDFTQIPTTLAASVLSRLGRLGESRHVAQACAIIGAPVRFDFLKLLLRLPDSDLSEALERLVGARILVRDDAQASGGYRFGHALLQDVAYGSLLSSRRRALHRRVANLLQQHQPKVSELQPEIMARHWAGAAEPQLAVTAWSSAGLLAVQRRAFAEARDCYRAALDLLMSLPETAERDSRELEIRYALFAALQITAGYSADELSHNTARARQLTERSGDGVKMISLATGAWAALSSAGDYDAACRIADEVSALAERDAGPENLAHGHMVQITARSRIGDLVGAEAAFIAGRRYFETTGFRRKPGAIAQTFGNAAIVAALQGARGPAMERAEWALQVAGENDNPYDTAFANHMAASTFLIVRALDRAHETAQRSVSLSDEHDYPQFSAIARIALGRATAELEDPTIGVSLIHQGLEAMARTGARAGLTMYLVWLAEAQNLAGSSGNAMATLERALTINPQERLYRSEALKIRGLLGFHKGDFEMGERDLGAALAQAREIGAHRFALRAACALAELNMSRGRPKRAVTCLREALAVAPVAPDDPDIVQTRTLLERLVSRSTISDQA